MALPAAALAVSFLSIQVDARTSLSSFNLTNSTLHQFDDPAADPLNPLKYIPSKALAIVALTLYALVATILLVELIKFKGKYSLTLIIGGYCYALGMALRIPFALNPESSGVYIVLYLFTVLSPCSFLAFDYILLGRLVNHLEAGQYLLINPNKTMRIFVGSDVVTFLIQAAGGGLSSSHDANLNRIGSKIFLAGIVLQMASFFFFTCTTILFGIRVRKHEPALWASGGGLRGWKILYFGMIWSCVGFLTRSVFRSVELSQGFTGHLSTHEVYIYCLDTLPLFLAIITYIPLYPTLHIGKRHKSSVASSLTQEAETAGSMEK